MAIVGETIGEDFKGEETEEFSNLDFFNSLDNNTPTRIATYGEIQDEDLSQVDFDDPFDLVSGENQGKNAFGENQGFDFLGAWGDIAQGRKQAQSLDPNLFGEQQGADILGVASDIGRSILTKKIAKEATKKASTNFFSNYVDAIAGNPILFGVKAFKSFLDYKSATSQAKAQRSKAYAQADALQENAKNQGKQILRNEKFNQADDEIRATGKGFFSGKEAFEGSEASIKRANQSEANYRVNKVNEEAKKRAEDIRRQAQDRVKATRKAGLIKAVGGLF